MTSRYRLSERDGELIDRGVALVFEEGRSFTGERICEFQVHVGATFRGTCGTCQGS